MSWLFRDTHVGFSRGKTSLIRSVCSAFNTGIRDGSATMRATCKLALQACLAAFSEVISASKGRALRSTIFARDRASQNLSKN